MNSPEEKKAETSSDQPIPKKKRPPNVFDGTLQSINLERLVLKTKSGQESSITLSAKIKVNCDGIACECKHLKPGQKIRVSTKKTDFTVATRIAALDQKSRFTPSV